MDALVVASVQSAGFFGLKRKIAEALAGAHLSGAHDQMVRVHLADRVAILEVELDGREGVIGLSLRTSVWQIRRSFLSARVRVRPWAARAQPVSHIGWSPLGTRSSRTNEPKEVFSVRIEHVSWERGLAAAE